MVTIGQHVYNALLLSVLKYLASNVPPSSKLRTHSEEGLTIRDVVPLHGYGIEEHEVQTEDGYLLTMFRLLRSPPNGTMSEASGRVPVLLMHGFLGSAHDFVVTGPRWSIAYKLLDAGYDVWLGNCRGNTFSRRHIALDPASLNFWRFSIHEIGYYDLPAQLEHVSRTTGHQRVHYVGHSQGATTMFIMASERPEAARRVRLFTALAPVVFPRAMASIVAQVAAFFYTHCEWLMEQLQYVEMLRHDDRLTRIFQLVSRTGTRFTPLFHVLVNANLGYSNDTDHDMYSLIVGNFPAGASTRQLLHFLQNINSDSFRKYNHGPSTNLRVYGQVQPPRYNLKTALPTAIFYSSNDWLSSEDDVDRVCGELKNLKLKHRMRAPYAHGDFIFGRQTPKDLFVVMDKLLRKN